MRRWGLEANILLGRQIAKLIRPMQMRSACHLRLPKHLVACNQSKMATILVKGKLAPLIEVQRIHTATPAPDLYSLCFRNLELTDPG